MTRVAWVLLAVAGVAGTAGAQQGTTYRVPAGTHLALELRTTVDSERAAPGDQVDAVVTTAIYSGETEVVPRGARVQGAVSQATPRTKSKPGRVVFSFSVLEHPDTHSRVALRTTAVSVDGSPAVRHGMKTTPPTAATARAGSPLDVSLLDSFSVLIPRK
jgi:hypothetical protein